MSKAIRTLSKPPTKTPPKTPERPALHPEVQDIILHTRCEVFRLKEQISGIKAFNFNVSEDDASLYDFSTAMHTVLEMIQEHAQQIHKMLGVAGGYVPETELERLPWREKE
jgi:hypothetical protein